MLVTRTLSPCLQALAASPVLRNILSGEATVADMRAQDPAVARECDELLVWQDFYQLERYADAAVKSAFSCAAFLFRPYQVECTFVV